MFSGVNGVRRLKKFRRRRSSQRQRSGEMPRSEIDPICWPIAWIIASTLLNIITARPRPNHPLGNRITYTIT